MNRIEPGVVEFFGRTLFWLGVLILAFTGLCSCSFIAPYGGPVDATWFIPLGLGISATAGGQWLKQIGRKMMSPSDDQP